MTLELFFYGGGVCALITLVGAVAKFLGFKYLEW